MVITHVCDRPVLQMYFGYKYENKHQLYPMVRYREELQQIKELLKKNPQGMSITEIARELSKNMHSIGRYLDILQATGQVDMRQYGMAKVFSLSQRLPLAAMINFAGEGVMVLDAELRVVMVNDYFLRILEKNREDVTGKSIDHLPIAALDVQELLGEIAHLPEKEVTEGGFDVRLDGDRFFKVKHAPTVFEDGNRGFIVILIDMTERMRAEHALQESEKKYRELVENAGSIILKMDGEGNITFFNEYAQEFFGYREEEILGQNVVGTIVSPTEASGRDLTALMREICAGSDRFAINENENITRDGRRVWVRWSNRTIVGDDGTPAGILSIGNDITERRAIEEQLTASERRFRDLADLLPLPVFETDTSLTIRYANRQAFETFGYSPSECRDGLSILETIAPEEREQAKSALKGLLAGSPGAKADCTGMRRDGTRFPMVAYSSPIVESGIVVGIRGAVLDMTARTEAEEALRQERDFSNAVLDTVDALVLVLDAAGRIVRFNAACEKATGYTSAEVLGRTIWDTLLPGEEAASVRTAFDDLLAKNGSRHARSHWVTKDGTRRLIAMSNAVLRDRDGVPEYVIGTGLDITEQKRTAEELQECREKLRQLRHEETSV